MVTGRDGGTAAETGSLRASHADRERVVGTLKSAFVDGRLEKDEFDDRVGQALVARTYAELATFTADIPARPAPASPLLPEARPPVNKEAVKWGLIGAGALIPPAMFVAGVFGVWPLALLSVPLLGIELIVAIVLMAVTLASQHKDRSRASRGQPGAAATASP